MINAIGLGLGPTAVALATDQLSRDRAAVDRSLLLVGLAADSAAVVLLGLGLGSYRRSLDDFARRDRGPAWEDSSAASPPVPRSGSGSRTG